MCPCLSKNDAFYQKHVRAEFFLWRWLILTCLHILVVALIVGIIAGPLVSNGFDPNSWNDADEITKELTRCILAIQVSRESVYEVFQLIDCSHFSSLGNGCRYWFAQVMCHTHTEIIQIKIFTYIIIDTTWKKNGWPCSCCYYPSWSLCGSSVGCSFGGWFPQ